MVQCLAKKKGLDWNKKKLDDYKAFKETQYDKLAMILRENLKMEDIYGMLREARLDESYGR